MAPMILFAAFCIASIVFLVSFFVALCCDHKMSRYVLKVHREVYIDAQSGNEGEIDDVASQAA